MAAEPPRSAMGVTTDIFAVADAMEQVLRERNVQIWDAITALTHLTAKALAVTIKEDEDFAKALLSTQEALAEMAATWRK